MLHLRKEITLILPKILYPFFKTYFITFNISYILKSLDIDCLDCQIQIAINQMSELYKILFKKKKTINLNNFTI